MNFHKLNINRIALNLIPKISISIIIVIVFIFGMPLIFSHDTSLISAAKTEIELQNQIKELEKKIKEFALSQGNRTSPSPPIAPIAYQRTFEPLF